ncbi:sterol desaturase family protein [Marinomonas balearica]|uniref:Sterol desaturase/sphingolipid hydroxylase (Fatty acid hydroxylase superfamily) n=1 Tax=Marinomonas balearica TaxID=491947 RepID=A0A4V3CHC4_9GAMM|nr:sterol desaturase family protein [Marinomonas balearica]TDP01103.1 sterol desaturase/sphingolipid hydroxylase (fatty acid hydroxylase superfamily) [Marinomonas balearica]
MSIELGGVLSSMIAGYSEWLVIELSGIFSDLTNLKKRVSLPYLLTGILFTYVIFYLRYRATAIERLKPLFTLTLWTNRSARSDYGLWILNRLILPFIYPKLITKLTLITFLMYQLGRVELFEVSLALSDWQVMTLFSVSYFLLDDFSRFYTHRLMHWWPFLWQFHRVHHSATVLTPFTVLRTHPIEGVLFYLRSLAVQSVLVSTFIILFPGQVSLFMVMGVFASTFVFNLLGANLRHSPIPLSYGSKIEKWIISPAQHQLHHSRDKAHYDCNFGVVLAIWDRLFSSWAKGSDSQKLLYGTGTSLDQSHVVMLYVEPFISLARSGVSSLRRLIKHR